MPRSITTTDEYDFIEHDDAALSPEIVAKIRTWLQPTDYLADSGEFRRHVHSRAPGTGLWMCNTSEYQQWHDSPDHGSLWIKGVPGAGKSVIAASMINHLKITEHVPVLFFFFRNIVSSNFTPRSLIQDWLAQLLPHSPRLQTELEPSTKTPLAEVSDNGLIDYFLDGLSNLRRVYCIVDALDEMATENTAFLSRLNSLANHRPASVKLLMTSRPKQYLQSALRESSIIHISLQQTLVDSDIVSYIQHRLDVRLQHESRQALRQDVVDMVATKSNGLFLYAKLMMDQVEGFLENSQPLNLADLEGILPAGLRDTYTSILEKQRHSHAISIDMQRTIFESVISAARPLRLNELSSLLALIYADDERASLKSKIAIACGPLVEILEDETLQIIHHSLTEILRGDDGGVPLIHLSTAHEKLSRCCLSYIVHHLEPMEISESESPRPAHYARDYRTKKDKYDYQAARLEHPLLKYAVDNWSYHASQYDMEAPHLFYDVQEFCKPSNTVYQRWVSLVWGLTAWNTEIQTPLPTALHIAAYSGMTTFAKILLSEESVALDAVDFQRRTPLHWAAFRGHARIVALLLSKSAAPALHDVCGLTPLHVAARHDRAPVIALLLEAGGDPLTEKTEENHPGRLLGGELITKGETPLSYMCCFGHIDSIRVLLPQSSPELVAQLLCNCLMYRRKEAAQIIIEESDVPGNAVHRGGTALYFACLQANVKAARALIDRGADVNAISKWNPRPRLNGGSSHIESVTPIQALIQAWTQENDAQCNQILQMLLEAGVDLENIDERGATPLLIAAGAQHRYHSPICPHAITALVAAGADTTKRNSEGDTVMHLVLGRHTGPVLVSMLLEHGCSVNDTNGSGQTPLYLALRSTRTTTGTEQIDETVAYLLDQGADPNIKDKHGLSPLLLAESDSLATFRRILDLTNNMGTMTQCLYSLSIRKGYDHVVTCIKLLQAKGVDINATQFCGRTPIMSHLYNETMLKAFKDCGARLDTLDIGGKNALHIVCSSHPARLQHLRQLIGEGLDPLQVDQEGNTLLHHMSTWYSGCPEEEDQLRFLANSGISINAPNKRGMTLLHTHIESGRVMSSHNGKAIVPLLDALNGLDEELDIDTRSNEGLTPLHLAAMKSEVWVLKLLRNGANPLALTPDRRSALHLASRAGQSNTVGYLLQKTGGQMINQPDVHGRTPLQDACASGRSESIYLLLKEGADVNFQARIDGMNKATALHACAEIVQDPRLSGSTNPGLWDLPDHLKRPRSRFAENDFVRTGSIVKMVLGAGADPMAEDSSGYTAFEVAMRAGLTDMVEPFMEDEKVFEALLEAGNRRNPDPNFELYTLATQVKAQCALSKKGRLSDVHQGELREQIIQSPWSYLRNLGPTDLDTIIKERQKSGTVDIECVCKLLRHILKFGLVEHLKACKGLLNTLHDQRLVEEGLSARGYPQFEEDFLPALHQTCSRSLPNLQMLQVLVDDCDMDVDMHAKVIYSSTTKHTEYRDGPVALHVLSSADHWWQLEGIRYLVARGANIDALDEHGNTPLHIAAQGRKLNNMSQESGTWRDSCVDLLLQLGARPNILNKLHQTPLHKASTAPEIMHRLLEGGADPSAGKVSPMFMAIHDQNPAALEVMLNAGADINAVDISKRCQVSYKLQLRVRYALLCAAWPSSVNIQAKDSIPLVKILVERGADLHLPVSDSELLMHCIFENAEYCIVDTLLQEPCVSRINFDHRDQRGRTVLMAAANWLENLPGYNHQHWVAKLVGPCIRMIDLGADVTAVDDEGMTVLHHILNNPDIEDDTILQLINRTEAESTVLKKDKHGYSPLHYAMRLLRPFAITALLDKGADLHETDPEDKTALHHIAAQCLNTRRPQRALGKLTREQPKNFFESCIEIWDRYLSTAGFINASNDKGNTPLHTYFSTEVLYTYSAKDPNHTHINRYDRLFNTSSDVDVQAMNHDGETILHIIAKRKKGKDEDDKAMFEFMMKQELDPLKEDAKGRSSLDVASACGKAEILDIFGRK